MRLETSDGRVRYRDYPDYFDRHMAALVPPRCRICPDALAELADVSIGDAWLDRFEGSDGVSDLIVRTPAGERLLADLAGRLELTEATPEEMVASQSETYRVKRDICRGRLWLRSLAGRPLPHYPGLESQASAHDRWLGAADAAEERLFRMLADRRFPPATGQ
jgi:coenzyme F420 hydrogenase subunit beta